MRGIYLIIIWTGLLGLVGCASKPFQIVEKPSADDTSQLAAADAAETKVDIEVIGTTSERSDVICRRVRPTGSHIAVRKCYTRSEQQEQQEAATEWMRQQRGAGPEIRDSPTGR